MVLISSTSNRNSFVAPSDTDDQCHEIYVFVVVARGHFNKYVVY